MNFLIQTINGQIVHDFSFELLQSIPFVKVWRGDDSHFRLKEGMDFKDITDPDKYIPVGSVEFVSEYLKAFYPHAEKALRPLNVPECLFPFAGRKICNVYGRDDFEPMKGIKDIYAKDIDTIKSPLNGIRYDVPGNYESKDFQHKQVSEVIDILSEWRVIVFQGTIQYIGNYSGEPLAFPDAETIRQMVDAYEKSGEAHVAYALDVAVTNELKTVVIECHRFFSCGLYGFRDVLKLPYMFSQTWAQMKLIK